MEGRLCCLNFQGYDSNDKAYSPRDAEFLLKLFPNGSVLFADARKWAAIQDGYVTWTVIVVSPQPLDEKRWNELHKSVEQLIHLSYIRAGVEVAKAGKELDSLNRWEEKTKSSGYGVQTGSVEKLKEAMRRAIGQKRSSDERSPRRSQPALVEVTTRSGRMSRPPVKWVPA